MTAEIAILNRQAVALAADSAVTVTVPWESGTRQKVFTSANKVFSLSRYQPVGIMVYGSASFMQMPWETVIKDYRRTLGRRALPHLGDYASGFLDHLRDGSHLASPKDEDAYVRNNLLGYFRFVAEIVGERVAERGPTLPSREVVETIATEVVDEHAKAWEAAAPVIGLTVEESVRRVAERVRSAADEVRTEVFESTPLSSAATGQLAEIAVHLFTRDNPFRSANAGIVIAGFGETDLYPQLLAYNVDGRVSGVLHAIERNRVNIADGTTASIIPFAQREVVDTFLGGVDPDYQSQLEDDFEAILGALPQIILDQVPDLEPNLKHELLESSSKNTVSQFADYRAKLEKLRSQWFVLPIIRMVVSMPKEDLASMAEALVNLTSLRRRVSPDTETVAGPIDVAIISKGDGLIWIKRKHYFRAELNQHFFATYFKDSPDATD